MRDFFCSITLKDKDNHIVIQNHFNSDSHVVFWIDKHEISEELYNQIREDEHFSEINDKNVLQSDYEESSNHNLFNLFAHQHRREHETDIEKIDLSKDESVYLFKQNNDVYMISPETNENGLETYRISDGHGMDTFGFVSKQKDIDTSLQLKETTYNYNLFKPLNNDVIKKINENFDLHLSNRKIKSLQICECSLTDNKAYIISFKNKDYCIMKNKSYLSVKVEQNDSSKMIYKSKKENLVGTEIDKIQYDPELFTKEIWTKICDVIGDDINAKSYEDMIKNANVMNKEKDIKENNKEER